MSIDHARLIAADRLITDPFRIREAAEVLLGRINASHHDIRLATEALGRVWR